MKRYFALVVVLVLVMGLAVMSIAQAAPPKDPLGCVAIKKGQPIHIAYWMVVAGGDSSLGIDTRRGVELAIADKGGKLLGYPIKLSGQDTGCNAEGGQAAATKLASDPSIVAAVGSNCSSEARPGAPILWKAGIATVYKRLLCLCYNYHRGQGHSLFHQAGYRNRDSRPGHCGFASAADSNPCATRQRPGFRHKDRYQQQSCDSKTIGRM